MKNNFNLTSETYDILMYIRYFKNDWFTMREICQKGRLNRKVAYPLLMNLAHNDKLELNTDGRSYKYRITPEYITFAGMIEDCFKDWKTQKGYNLRAGVVVRQETPSSKVVRQEAEADKRFKTMENI